ncbi:hypothetical protein RIR_jg18809.t1 [Rhizophagus irregularis DAOM 181602=DAOM 197198]|nr:hypothetical protein RIR_jg18809.t1 [Rhizophagus irregularis DAOM 181602=DAOM 197198]
MEIVGVSRGRGEVSLVSIMSLLGDASKGEVSLSFGACMDASVPDTTEPGAEGAVVSLGGEDEKLSALFC